MFTAEHMVRGIQAVAALQRRVLAEDPMAAGPLNALRPHAPTSSGPAAPPAELLEAHCHGCGGKKAFQVEGEDQMPNGAIRKYGKAICGHRVSTFVSGATNG